MSPSIVIERLGGVSEVARLCECTPQAVSQWHDGIPKAREMYLRAVRPDVFVDGEAEGAEA